MSLEKTIQKLTDAITAAADRRFIGIDQRFFGIEPSRIPGWRRVGDCPNVAGILDYKRLERGMCCFSSSSQGCLRTCGGDGPSYTLISEGPCPQDGLFTPDDTETGQG